jgi:hypothetical protein
MTQPKPFASPSGISYSREELSPFFLETVRVVKAELPELLSRRLSHGRHAVNHGSYNDFYLINLWDKHQSSVLPRHHFTYCLNYWENRRDGVPEDGQLHLWINKIRLYQNQQKILQLLDRKLPKAVPDGFTFKSDDRAYSISHRFYLPADMDLFAGYIIPLFKQLVLSIHPILMEVIDDWTGPMEKEELRQVIRERDRIPFQHPGRRTEESLRAYNRSIAPALRKKILRKADYQCVQCGHDLHQSGHHIDHIIPFSRGGLTTEDNLQALCPRCNLRKGNR